MPTFGVLDAIYRVARIAGFPGNEAIVGEGCVMGTADAVAHRGHLNVRVVRPDDVADALSGNTAMVVVPHVDPASGQVTDLERILDANEGNAELVVDASASAGAIDLGEVEDWTNVILRRGSVASGA